MHWKTLFIVLSLSLQLSAISMTTMAQTVESLYDIYQAASKNDPIIRAAQAQLRSQKEVANAARGLLLPQISARYSITDTKSQASLSTSIASNSDFRQEGWSIAATQTLFNLGTWYNFKSSKKLSRRAEAEFQKNQQELVYRTIDAYLQVLRAYENLSSAMAEEAAIAQQLDQTQQRYDVGLVAITDVHESRAAYDLAKVGRLTQEGALSIAYEGLTLLTNQDHSRIAQISEKLPILQPEPANKHAWVILAKKHSPELKSNLEGVKASEYHYRAAKSQHWPILTARISKNNFKGSGSIGGTVVPSGGKNEQEVISLNLQIPIFSGGTVSANRRKAYANFEAAKEGLLGLERSIQQQTRANYLGLMMNIQQVAARKQSIISATSALESTKSGYDAGTRNIVDVLNVQRNLFSARRDYATARFDYILSYIELKKITGLLSPADIDWINQWLENRPATLVEARKALNEENNH